MGMIPGMNRMKQMQNIPKPDEKELGRVEAIINSMTAEERRRHEIIGAGRRQRIANGSGTTVQDVNKVLKSYAEMLKVMKKMKGKGVFGAPPSSGGKKRKMPKGMFR